MTSTEAFREMHRRSQVAMNYRSMARSLRREARLAFKNGCEAAGAKAVLALRVVERAASDELHDRQPAGLG